MKSQNLTKQAGKNSRIKTYLALTAGFVAISPLADAQIIYTDVNPDSVLTGTESLLLDINNDGVFDYKITQGYLKIDTVNYFANWFSALNDNQVFSAGVTSMGSSWHYVPMPLNFWDDMKPVGYNRVWKKGGRLSFSGNNPWMYSSLWRGLKDKYAGLKFKINGEYYFGWARMDVDSSSKSLTLKDYAYYDEAEKPIRAGSVKVSLPDDNPMKNIRVYSTAGVIKIETPVNENINGTIILSDINGMELKSVIVKNLKNIELNAQELPGGLYIVNIRSEKGILNKKVLIR
jgi:hypothetical protein